MVAEVAGEMGQAFDDAIVEQLARILMGEARGEGAEGMQAVGNVVMNRVSHSWFPNTLGEVMSQPDAFSSFSGDITPEAMNIANDLLSNQLEDITGGASNFHSFKEGSSFIPPEWGDAKKYKHLKTIGGHNFYRGE